MAMRYLGQRISAPALTPRQADLLGMALLSGMLVMPVAMLLTKFIATTMPPLAVAPSAPLPREAALASTPLVARNTAPPQVLPTESVPPPLASGIAAPPAAAPTLPPPAALPGLSLPPAQGAPALAGAMPLTMPGAKSMIHVPLTPHAAVLALMTMMRVAAAKAKPLRRALKDVATARNHPLHATSAAKEIPPGVMTDAIDPGRSNLGVLGGPTAPRAGAAGLNGTGMRHRL
jgi:hypothetical protein